VARQDCRHAGRQGPPRARPAVAAAPPGAQPSCTTPSPAARQGRRP
jgi:hypothetical protein